MSGFPALPGYVIELGINLVNSCPTNGVIVTGSDLEAVGVWYAVFGSGRRTTVVPILPELYAADANYRRGMAQSLGIDPEAPAVGMLTEVARRRPLCLTPTADSSVALGVPLAGHSPRPGGRSGWRARPGWSGSDRTPDRRARQA